MFVTHVMRFAETCGHGFIVICQLSEHVQWFDVFGVVIAHSLSTRDLPGGMQRKPAELANSFGNHISNGKKLLSMLVKEQVIIAEMMSTHMPVKIFRFQVQREHICKDCVHGVRDILCRFRR